MKQENDAVPELQQDPNFMPPLKRAIPLGLQHGKNVILEASPALARLGG